MEGTGEAAGSSFSRVPTESSTGSTSTQGLSEIPASDRTTLCKLCFLPSDPDRLGTLYQYVVNPVDEVYCGHFFCLLFSSGLDQNGDDEEEIKGFRTQDILKEWRRGQRLKCFYCHKRYSTVGCPAKGCKKSFHLPCGLDNGGLPQFNDDFAFFCKDHRPSQEGSLPGARDGESPSCGVCLEDISGQDMKQSEGEGKFLSDFYLWAPCCNGWYHRHCVESLAKSTGYFFKCALCNNKVDFEKEMKKFGVHVPERDAAWEVDDSTAFEDLLERHGHCDAEECLCPDGRTEDVDYTPWEVILCRCCGAQGIHLQCGNLPGNVEHPKWTCTSCKKVLSALPPTYINHYRRVINDCTKVDMRARNLLRNTTFTLQDGRLVAQNESARITAPYSEGPVLSVTRPEAQPEHPVSEPEITEPPEKDDTVVGVNETGNQSPRKRKEFEVKCERVMKRLKKAADPKQRSILTYFSTKSPKKGKEPTRLVLSKRE